MPWKIPPHSEETNTGRDKIFFVDSVSKREIAGAGRPIYLQLVLPLPEFKARKEARAQYS